MHKHKLHQLREQMQIIFQDPFASLNPRMTVEETIREPLELSGKFKKGELSDETDRIMEMVGIDERLRYAYPHELDGGRRQRVGIGRALALDPAFVVCDEPVSCTGCFHSGTGSEPAAGSAGKIRRHLYVCYP